jgi:hypothetical protein
LFAYNTIQPGNPFVAASMHEADGKERFNLDVEMPAQFSISEVEDNEEGWGPTSIPDHLAGVPYAPYGKGDKVGKISDFTQAAGKFGGVYQNNQINQPPSSASKKFVAETLFVDFEVRRCLIMRNISDLIATCVNVTAHQHFINVACSQVVDLGSSSSSLVWQFSTTSTQKRFVLFVTPPRIESSIPFS